MEIDCPSDCFYLHSGRDYESRKSINAGPALSHTERLWRDEFIIGHSGVFLQMWEAVLRERQRFPELVDSDFLAALEALIQTYQTLDKGIYYESFPSRAIQRELYLSLKTAFESFGQEEELSKLKTGTILDCLTFHKEMGMAKTLPRPKSRAFLDYVEDMYRSSVSNPMEEPRIILP